VWFNQEYRVDVSEEAQRIAADGYHGRSAPDYPPNRSIDAYQHCLASCYLTVEWGEDNAHLADLRELGVLIQVLTDMGWMGDAWDVNNNRIGRSLGRRVEKTLSGFAARHECQMLCADELQSDRLLELRCSDAPGLCTGAP
jgi:hypothetical protein